MSSRRITAAVCALLVLYWTVAYFSLRGKSSVYDEHPHIMSGFSHLETGKFSGGLDNPPLLQVYFVLPAWLAGVDYRAYVDEHLDWFRIPAILLGAACGLLVFRWSSDLYGRWAGLFSLVLYVCSTGCMGLSRFATLDFGAAFFFLATLYTVHLWLESPGPARLLLAAVVLGLALCTKYTLMPLVGIVPALLVFSTPGDNRSDGKDWWRRWLSGLDASFLSRKVFRSLLPMLLIAFLTVNACFLFEGFLQSKSLPAASSSPLLGERPHSTVLSILGRFLPTSFHHGLAAKLKQAGEGREAFLWGKRWPNGTVLYYLACLYLKTPLAFQLMLLWLAVLLLTGEIGWGEREARLWMPVLFLFSYISILSRVNIGFRHVIFVLPALHVLLGSLVKWVQGLSARRREARVLLTILLFFHVAAFTFCYPHFIEFFTITIGGSQEGYRYLVDSNLDWGQDDALPLRFAAERKLPRLQVLPPPFEAGTGWFALSANTYQAIYFAEPGKDKRAAWSWLKRFKPVKRLANTWFIYHVEESDYLAWAESHPDDVWGWLDLAFIRMRRNDISKTYEALQKAEALAPAGRGETLLRMGQLALIAGDVEEAIRRLDNALNVDPANDKAKQYLTIAQAERELRRLASEEGATKPEDSPLVSAEIYKIVRAYGLLKQFPAADAYLNRLRRCGADKDPYYWVHSAYLDYYLGRFELAARHAERALQLSPDDKEVKEAYEFMTHLATLLRSKQAMLRYNGARRLEAVGQYRLAMSHYLAAHELDRARPEPLWAMGALQICRRLGSKRFNWP